MFAPGAGIRGTKLLNFQKQWFTSCRTQASSNFRIALNRNYHNESKTGPQKIQKIIVDFCIIFMPIYIVSSINANIQRFSF